MKRLSFQAALGVALALITLAMAAIGPAHAASSPVPIYFAKQDPCPGATLCGNFTTNRFKAAAKITPIFSALPGLTVTRSTGGYAENPDGSLVWFQPGQARATRKGLLAEESRTNLFLWSQDLTNAVWTKGGSTTVTASAVLAPDGTATAQRVQLSAAQNIALVTQAVAAAAGQTHVEAFWVKSNTGGNQKFAFKLTQQGVADHFSADQTATTSWQRFTFTQAFGSGGTGNALAGLTTDAAGDATDLVVWQGDFNANASFITSPVPTTTAAATRAADQVFLSGLNSPAAYTLYAKFSTVNVTSNAQAISFDDGTSNNRVQLGAGFGQEAAGAASAGVSQFFTVYANTAPASGVINMAFRVATNNAAVFANGVSLTTTGTFTVPSANRLALGMDRLNSSQLDGYLQSVALYPTGLSDAQLQALTAGPDTSSLSLNFASGLYKTTTPYVRTNWLHWGNNLQGGAWTTIAGATITGPATATLASTLNSRVEQAVASSVGQAWTYASTLSGSGVVGLCLTDNGGSFGSTCTPVTLTPTPTRYFVQRTMNDASANGVIARINNTSGSVVSATATQNMLEKGSASPSSYIDTTTDAASVATTQSTNPADVGALTVTRASGGYAQWTNGSLQWFPANTPRITDQGLLVEELRTNKATNFNVAPTDLTNVTKFGDAAATLTVVDDSAALTAAGINVGNGKVYKLDCSACVATAGAVLLGQVGNLNTHTYSLYERGGTGSLGGISGTVPFAGSLTYVRRIQTATPSGATNNPSVIVNAGQVVYFILNQLEEGSFATSPIPVDGAAATRAADAVSYAYALGQTKTVLVEGSGRAGGASGLFRTTPIAPGSYIASVAAGGDATGWYVSGLGAVPASSASKPTDTAVAVDSAGYFHASRAGGAAITSAASDYTGGATGLDIGVANAANNYANQYIRRLEVLPYAANDNELQYRSAGNF